MRSPEWACASYQNLRREAAHESPQLGETLVARDTATAPAGATGAAFSVRLLENEAGGSLALPYDGACLVDGLIYLFNDDFERQSSCHGSTVVP